MSTYKDSDKCTDVILDFIAGGRWGDELGNPIGEADGNYNAYFGHVHSTVDFSKMSLGEIYDFQRQMLLNDRRSTAIGRYQFLRRTLQVLQRRLNLPNSTLFTHEVQDRMAVELLVARGYKSWWRGALSNDEFLSHLSMEWASLPDPYNNGKSHYDGDNVGNHASTNLKNARKMLVVAKANIR